LTASTANQSDTVEHFRAAVADPKYRDASACNNLGVTLMNGPLESKTQAVGPLREAIDRDVRLWTAHYALAHVSLNIPAGVIDVHEAAAAMDQALHFVPAEELNPTMHLDAIRVYFYAGQYDKMRQQMEAALAAGFPRATAFNEEFVSNARKLIGERWFSALLEKFPVSGGRVPERPMLLRKPPFLTGDSIR
jgi:hypothetical protein